MPPRTNSDRRGGSRSTRDAPRRGAKKKVCIFCSDRIAWVDYKDVNVLRRFMSERGKIRARRVSGCCTQHQREISIAIKTARELALLPYAQRTVSERAGGRGPRGPRSDRGDRGLRDETDAVEAELASRFEEPEAEVDAEVGDVVLTAVAVADDDDDEDD